MVYNMYGKAGYEALDEAALLKAARGLIVKTRNRLVMELQLKKIVQGPDQPVQSFLASLKPIARNCKFQVTCTAEKCGQSVDFTDKMVLQQLIYGLADEDIQRKILAKPEMTLKEAEKFVIGEESGKWSQLESKSERQIAAGMLHGDGRKSSKKRKRRRRSRGSSSRSRSRSRSSSDEEDQDVDDMDTDKSNLGVKIIELVEESLGVTIKKKRSRIQRSCKRCGKETHSKNEVCPASEVECRKCDRVGHYARVCRSKKDY